jgi:hypothetical protein
MKISNLNVEEAAVVVVEVTKNGKPFAELRQHWSSNAGMYGHQIASRSWLNINLPNQEYRERKTNGWGFCKLSDDFSDFACRVIGSRCNQGGDAAWHLKEYHVGGNFYRVPFKAFKRIMAVK